MQSSVHVVPDAVGRQLVHLRQVEMAAFVRDDGLWDLEVTLTDRKSRLVLGGAKDHVAGVPIHDMRLALTVETGGDILGVEATMHAVPYDDSCTAATNEYQMLVGLNLFSGFRASLRQRIAQRNACSHLSELATMLPTLALQSFAGVIYPIRDDASQREPNAAIDRCRGLRADGEAVRLYYPRWYRGPVP